MLATTRTTNYWDIKYLTLLVQAGWFDEVRLLFGEVGHTHNGGDVVHKIHNQDLGGLFSADFGHLVWNYPKAWHYERNRPVPSVLDKMFDWKGWLTPNMRKLSGYTKTSFDPYSVRGWQVSKSKKTGVTVVKWKMDPAIEPEWRGIDGRFDSEGMHLFTALPQGLPPTIAPGQDLLPDAYRKSMLSPMMAEMMMAEGTPQAVQYNYDAAQHGEIIQNECLEDTHGHRNCHYIVTDGVLMSA